MTIREVIDMLKMIFEELMALLAPLFEKSEEEGTETEAPEATV